MEPSGTGTASVQALVLCVRLGRPCVTRGTCTVTRARTSVVHLGGLGARRRLTVKGAEWRGQQAWGALEMDVPNLCDLGAGGKAQ